MPGPLEGIRVCDCTLAAVGPLATTMMAHLGAYVVKVEAPSGDVSRDRPPTQKGLPILYSRVNRGKKAIILDLKSREGYELLAELIRQSDIFVHNWRVGVAERLNLGREEVFNLNPRIIYARVTGWGYQGPMKDEPATDPMTQAFSGWASTQGVRGGVGESSRLPGHLDQSAGIYLVGAILQALLRREATGKGQIVDISLLSSTLALQSTLIAQYYAGYKIHPLGSASSSTAPHEAFLCKDREYLAVGVLHDGHWRGLCKALDKPELLTDHRFMTNPDRVKNQAELQQILCPVFASRPSDWWGIQLTRFGVPHGRFYDWETIKNHIHVWQNGYIKPVTMPHLGTMYLVGPPWKFSETPTGEVLPVYPGQDTEEITAQLRQDIKRRPEVNKANGKIREVTGDPPLRGVKVLDLTSGVAGPYTSFLLAEAGAEVTKVEGPQRDYTRQMPPLLKDGPSAIFLALNHNKTKIDLDVLEESQRAHFRSLVKESDILIEEMRPELGERSHISYETIREINPQIIYCLITSFGEDGPLAKRPGSELVVQAMADYSNTLGVRGKEPVRMGADLTGTNTGSLAFNCILTALLNRHRTGTGQRISVSMYGTMLHNRGDQWAMRSEPEQWVGAFQNSYTNPPEDGYKLKDGRIYFSITRGMDEEFYQLIIELGMTDVLSDPRFLENSGRASVGIGIYAAELKPVWEKVMGKFTIKEFTKIANRYGGQVIPINDYDTVLNHPQVSHLGVLKEIEYGDGKKLKIVTVPWQLSECEVQ